MSKKKNRAIKQRYLDDVRITTVFKKLKLKDLQRECVMRGLSFKEVGISSIPNLHSFLIKNWETPVDRSLIDQYDEWVDNELKELGRDDLIHPALNLGSTQDNETGETIKKRIRQVKPQKKAKKQRTSDGIFAGTKKAYTFELAKQGIEKKEAIKMVVEKFPEAKEKSVSIWYNKAKKLG